MIEDALLEKSNLFVVSVTKNEKLAMLKMQRIYLSCRNEKVDLSIFLNSKEGSVGSRISFVDVINYISNFVRSNRLAYSMGSARIIASRRDQKKRSGCRHSTFSIFQRNALVATTHEFQFRIAIMLYKKFTENFESVIRQDLNWEHRFTARQSISYGIIDQLLFYPLPDSVGD